MKQILLFGKTGQLGEQLLKTAPSLGFKITGLDRRDLDVTNNQELNKIVNEIKPDILINATAYNLVGKAEYNPVEAMAVNCEAVASMAKICNQNSIQFVSYSTDYVFNGKKGTPYEENDLPNPLQAYGLSKLKGEQAVLNNHPSGSFVIRTNGLYGGEKGSPGKGNFVLNILKEAQVKEVIDVSCEQIVNPTYTGDLSVATLKLLQKETKPCIYHLASEGYCSWYEFAEEIFRLAGINKKLVPVDRRGVSGGVRRPIFSALKNTKAKALGVVLPHWKKGLAAYFGEYNVKFPR